MVTSASLPKHTVERDTPIPPTRQQPGNSEQGRHQVHPHSLLLPLAAHVDCDPGHLDGVCPCAPATPPLPHPPLCCCELPMLVDPFTIKFMMTLGISI